MSSIVSEIKDFLAHGLTSDALSRLLEMSQSNKQIHDSILIVLAEFNDLNAARLRGTIHNEEATLRQNKINEKVLMALDSFDSEGRVLPGISMTTGGRGTKFLLKLGLSILICSISIIVLGFIIVNKSEGEDSKLAGGALAEVGFYIGIGSLIVLGGWLLSVIVNALKGK